MDKGGGGGGARWGKKTEMCVLFEGGLPPVGTWEAGNGETHRREQSGETGGGGGSKKRDICTILHEKGVTYGIANSIENQTYL